LKKRTIAALSLLLAVLAAMAGDKGFSPPPASHANTYPAHETHEDEAVTIAIDPYDTPAKTAAIFKLKYGELGFLPIRLIISNDGGQTLMLNDLKVEYITAHRDKLEPATQEDMYRRIARPEKATNKPKINIPVPGPRKQAPPINREAAQEIQSAMFAPYPVTPHSTNSGFLFFDVLDISNPEPGAHLAISGIKAGTKEIFYFDIPLEKYLNSSQNK
jgi:hypothetical protein